MSLFLFLSLFGWLPLTVWLVWKLAKRIKHPYLFVLIWPLVYIAPVADEFIGQFQYRRYCKEAEEIKIYGTVPVGLELYTEKGKWRLSSMTEFGWMGIPPEKRKPLEAIVNSKIRWDHGPPLGIEVPATIPIRYYESKIYEVKTGRLLAESRLYATRGGWLSNILFERGGFFVKPQCSPTLLGGKEITNGYQLYMTILPFDNGM